MKIVLKDVTLINPEQKLNEVNSVLIEDGIIKKIGKIKETDLKDARVFEMEGKHCIPGMYDMHVHLREPGREDEETVVSGSTAAAAGGFTGLACMPNTSPAIDSAETVRYIKDKAKGHLVDVDVVAAASKGRKGEEITPMAELYEAGAVGFSDDGDPIKSASLLRTIMEYASMYNVPVMEHCEEPSMMGGAMNEGFVSTQLGLPPWPAVSEDLIVMRDIMMADYTDTRIHIQHISTKGAVELVRQAKAKGLKVTAEVTPHHFTLTDENLRSFDTNYKMNPPLRTQEDVDACIEGLKDGTIDCIASDHAPHSPEEKDMEFIYAPNGIIGLETQLGLTLSELVHKKHITIEKMVELLSLNPRKILGLNLPKIAEGEKANLSIFDIDEIWTVDIMKFKSKSRNSPFDKRLLTGKSIAAINNSKMFYVDEFINL